MNLDINAFAFGAAGSALQELAHWYELRSSLSIKQTQRLMRSRGYWILTALMVVGAGIGTLAWFEGLPASARQCMLVGAAFPLLLKKGIAAVGAAKPVTLGTVDNVSANKVDVGPPLLRAYFQISRAREE